MPKHDEHVGPDAPSGRPSKARQDSREKRSSKTKAAVPEARSPKPEARSPKPEARSQKPEA